MSSTMTIAKVKPVEVIFVEKPNVREEIKIRGPKGKEDTVVVDEQPTKEQIVEAGSKIEDAFKDLRTVMIGQNLEKIEAASQYFFCGCCKIETENRYFVKSLDTGETRLVAMEDSWWCLRNPCICCDCICWCCHR